jgi:sigma-B regulation protein RsbU (phosphoserine phosphatase)
MAHLHALFRSMIALGLPLAETVARVNRLFCQSTTSGAYATAVAGHVERSGRVELCNAGHPQPVLLGTSPTAAGATRGLPLGLFPGSEYRSFEVALGRGEGLVIYTDGLSEAENGAGDEYGHARICAALAAVGGASAREKVAAMLADLARWSGAAALGDDLTVLALRRLEP